MFQRLLKQYNSWKLGQKLMCAFALASIIPILFVQIFGFQLNRRNMTQKIDELMVNNLTQIAERVNLNIQVYTNLIYQIYRDEQVIENVLALTDEENSRKAVAYNLITDRLKQYNNSEAGIRCLAVVCPDGTSVVYDFQNDSSLDTIWHSYKDLRQIPPYREAVDAPRMVLTDTMTFQGDKNEGHFFHISKRLFDFDHLDRGSIGTVVMTIDERILNTICNNSGDLLEQSLNFILNEDRQIITYPDPDFSGMKMNPELKVEDFVQVSGYLRDQKIAINQYEDPVTGWIFCNAYDTEYMLRDLSRTQQALILVTLAVLLFTTLLIVYTVRTMDASVRSVVSGMQQVQKGNLDVVVPVQSFDEIGIISDNFNSMTVKVKELIHQVEQAKEQQKNAEIRALEAQINPHFLYNTLDSINWMAIEKEEYEISRMLRNLGVILRYSINKSNQKATIWEMEDWLKKYVSLHQMRLNDAFVCEIHVDERLYPRKVHKLLLQPFIENAILHGFKEMEGGGILHVDFSLAESGKEFTVLIEDNGKGMPPEMVRSFNDKEEAIRDDGRSIGLHNAFSRMHMYYGEAASWNVSSIQGRGTVITLRLPLLEEGEDENTDRRG